MSASVDRRSFIAGGAAAATAFFTQPASSQQAAGPASHGFGWERDRPDPSDRLLQAPAFASPAPRPKSKDLSAAFPPAYDQLQLGSCTANAIAAAVQYARQVHSKPDDFIPSRLFIYYLERKMESVIYVDKGAQIRDGIAAVARYGAPPEDKWPYDGIAGDPKTHVFPANARSIQEPPPEIMMEAEKYKTISYSDLKQDVAVLESCLAGGYPFIFGFTVYDNFDERTKILRKPGADDHITPYGHAVLATGYDQAKRTFRIRNSWGPASNVKGYFEMEYDYVLDSNLAASFWVVYQTLGFQ